MRFCCFLFLGLWRKEKEQMGQPVPTGWSPIDKFWRSWKGYGILKSTGLPDFHYWYPQDHMLKKWSIVSNLFKETHSIGGSTTQKSWNKKEIRQRNRPAPSISYAASTCIARWGRSVQPRATIKQEVDSKLQKENWGNLGSKLCCRKASLWLMILKNET